MFDFLLKRTYSTKKHITILYNELIIWEGKMEFIDIIDESQVLLDFIASDKYDAIRKLTELFDGKNIYSDKEGYYNAVLERESMYATAVGMEVAIPHGKTDIVKRIAVAFGKLKEPILWEPSNGEGEGDIVRIVFLLAVPDTNANNAHLMILASLARALMHDEKRNQFLNAETARDVMKAFENIPLRLHEDE